MNISKIVKKNKKSVILIDIQIPKENNQKTISIRGTGFIISSDGKFITCAHVYKQIPENEKEFLGVSIMGETDKNNITRYERYGIELLKIDEENDLALMKIKAEGKKFEPIIYDSSESTKEGEEAVFIGYPLATELLSMGFGITMTTNRCIISSIKRRGTDGSLHFFLIDTHTNNGSSGSPLFSSDSGKVIGIVSGKISVKIPTPDGKIIDVPANIGLCRPAKYIDNLLK